MTQQPIRLYNTMTRSIQEIAPIEPGTIKLYTCGLTVYCPPQIGNWVAYTYWDLLHRVLTQTGYNVNRVENYTDVGHLVSDGDDGEDKMEKGARQDGTTAWEVAERYIKIAIADRRRLGFLDQTTYVRATDKIAEQMAMVDALTAKGVTYELDDGIYFDSSQFAEYARLGRLDLDGLDAGHRIKDHGKRNASDFAVWKFSPKGATRDMEWEYPADSGRMGFPGWHLECSAIIKDALGDTVDIHTGGIDHIPVHHSNEIAQSHVANDAPLANIWLHNNFMKVAGDKLSKSTGNSYTLDDIVAREFSIDSFKVLVYSSHYRTEGNFSWEILESAKNRLNHWLQSISSTIVGASSAYDPSTVSDQLEVAAAALSNDLDSPTALSHIDQAVTDIDQAIDSGQDATIGQNLVADFLAEWLGIKSSDPINLSTTIDFGGESTTVKQLVTQRTAAKQAKDFATSDAIRDNLAKHGYELKDHAEHCVVSRMKGSL